MALCLTGIGETCPNVASVVFDKVGAGWEIMDAIRFDRIRFPNLKSVDFGDHFVPGEALQSLPATIEVVKGPYLLTVSAAIDGGSLLKRKQTYRISFADTLP